MVEVVASATGAYFAPHGSGALKHVLGVLDQNSLSVDGLRASLRMIQTVKEYALV